MAQEEIKLIGSFKDDITPKLKKLTKQIDSIGRSFEKFNRNLRPISREFGRMAASADRFNQSLAQQRSILSANARAMGEYKKQAGRMSGAMRAMQTQQEKMMRAQGVSRSQQRKAGGTSYIPGAPAPSRGGGKTPSRGVLSRMNPFGKKDGAGFGAQIGQGFTQSITTTAIGTSIGMMAGQALMGAARGIGNLISAPFKKFGSMFSERIKDEMDDIKSAGGLFALDMDLTQESGNERFFKSYNEALRMQEKLNIDMAQSAASLPGVTQQYVDVSRQLTDTIQMTMEKDREGFNKMAQSFGANVSMGGVDASKNAFQTVLKKQTEQLVLQSQGQTGGLPMHIAIQQLMSKGKGEINMTAFTNKFRAAFQKNPLLKNFLMRAEKNLNETEAGSADRLKLLMETFDAAMPKEVINKMRGSISGMQEALRSGLLDPQSGLFGMSRANIDPKTGKTLMKKNVDDLGNILYKVTSDVTVGTEKQIKELEKLGIKKKIGESVKGAEFTAEQLSIMGLALNDTGDAIKRANGEIVGEISKSSTYVFEQIREILAGYGPVLLEFVGFLPHLFDPFSQMTSSLMDFRDEAQQFVNGFNKKLDIVEKKAVFLTSQSDAESQGLGNLLKGQSRSRAAFSTVAETLKSLGGIDEALFQKVQGITGDFSTSGIKAIEDGALTKIVPDLLKSLWNSDLMKKFGKIGGLIVGGITKAVVDMIKNFTTILKGEGVNKLTEGFIGGFKDAFGGMSFNEVKGIVTDAAVTLISKSLDLLFNQVIPNLVKTYIGGLFKGLFSGSPVTMLLSAMGLFKFGSAMVSLTLAAQKAAFSLGTLGLGGKGRVAGRAAVGGRALLGKGKDLANAGKKFFFGGLKEVKGMGLMGKGGGLMNLIGGGSGKALAAGLKSGLKLGAVGGIIKAGMGLAEGKSPLDALSEGLASAGGSAIGAAIGTIIFPGIGTAIGAMIGGFIADTESVIAPIRAAIDSIIGSITVVGGILGEVGGLIGDIVVAVVSLFPGMESVSNGFNLLGAVVFALLSPFKMLELGLMGLKIVISEIRQFAARFGIGKFDEADRTALAEQKTNLQNRTDAFTIEGRQAAGFTLQQQKDAEYAKWQEAKTNDEKNRHAQYMKVIEAKIAAEKARKASPLKEEKVTTLAPGAPTAAIPAAPTAPAAAANNIVPTKPVVPPAPVIPETPSFKGKVSEMWQATTKSFGDAWDSVTSKTTDLTSAVSSSVSDLWNNVSGAVGDSLKTASEAMTEFASDPFYYLGLGIRESFLAIEKTMEDMGNVFIQVKDSVCEYIYDTGEGIYLGAIDFGKGIATTFSEVFIEAGNAIVNFGPWLVETATSVLNSIAEAIAAAFDGIQQTVTAIIEGIKSTIEGLGAAMTVVIDTFTQTVMSLPEQVSSGLGMVTTAIMEWVRSLPSKITGAVGSFMAGLTGKAKPQYAGSIPMYAGNVHTAAGGMNLGSAIATEMKNKPAGSDLVIANSSETIIPASMTAALAPSSAGAAGGGGQSITIGDIHVNVSGADNPREIANEVAEEILQAIKKTSYNEIFTS